MEETNGGAKEMKFKRWIMILITLKLYRACETPATIAKTGEIMILYSNDRGKWFLIPEKDEGKTWKYIDSEKVENASLGII